MGNMDLWERYEDIDPAYTKPITGRDYKGTSPNPQYVIKCLTDMFGPVGKGFGWNVLAEDFTSLPETRLHWCRIRFWWRDADGVYECEQYGQTKAAYVTSSGNIKVDEDAPKKSLTDAIIKAASHLGVAANIFLGRWDDQKYVAEVREEYRAKEEPAKKAEPANDAPKAAAPEWTEAMESLWRELNFLQSLHGLKSFWADNAGIIAKMPTQFQAKFTSRKDELKAKLEQRDIVDDIADTFGGANVVTGRDFRDQPLLAAGE